MMAPAQPHPDRETLDSRWTRREQEIIALIAEGLTNREIGIVLGVSRETIKQHVTNALTRSGCRSRSELVNVAWKRGLLPVDPDWIEAHLSRL